MDTQTECGPDPAFALAREFQQGLRALYDPTLKWGFSKELNRHRAAYEDARRQYCLDFLARIDSEVHAGESPASAAQIHVARAVIRRELSHQSTHPDHEWELLQQALADARASGHPQAIFDALLALGHFHGMLGGFMGEEGAVDHAEWYYKEALVYAHSDMPKFQIPLVLYWLGVTFASRSDTLPQAISMFDWASRFGPAEFGALVEKQKCRLQMGEREALLEEAQPPADADVMQIASAIAAMKALGRRRKRICEAARRGIELARCNQDTGWQLVFELVLKNHVRGAEDTRRNGGRSQ
jgi:hypothetical protein